MKAQGFFNKYTYHMKLPSTLRNAKKYDTRYTKDKKQKQLENTGRPKKDIMRVKR